MADPGLFALNVERVRALQAQVCEQRQERTREVIAVQQEARAAYMRQCAAAGEAIAGVTFVGADRLRAQADSSGRHIAGDHASSTWQVEHSQAFLGVTHEQACRVVHRLGEEAFGGGDLQAAAEVVEDLGLKDHPDCALQSVDDIPAARRVVTASLELALGEVAAGAHLRSLEGDLRPIPAAGGAGSEPPSRWQQGATSVPVPVPTTPAPPSSAPPSTGGSEPPSRGRQGATPVPVSVPTAPATPPGAPASPRWA